MSKLVYDRQKITWQIADLQRLADEGKATKLEPHGIWIVKKAEGGSVAVRPDQILVCEDMTMAEVEAQQKSEAHAEGAWLRAAESPTYDDVAHDEYERANGMVSFEDAYDAADPVHAAQRTLRHAERAAFDVATYENGKTSIGLETPEWEARMEAIVAEVLAKQGTSVAKQEAKVEAVAAAQALAAKAAQENDLLAKFLGPKG